jgi:hypothetical protein
VSKPHNNIPRPPIPDGSAFCTKCREVKPVGEFGGNKARPDGLAAWCRACLNRNAAEWKRRNPEQEGRRQAYHWRRKHHGSNLYHVPIGQKPHAIKKGRAA